MVVQNETSLLQYNHNLTLNNMHIKTIYYFDVQTRANIIKTPKKRAANPSLWVVHMAYKREEFPIKYCWTQ